MQMRTDGEALIRPVTIGITSPRPLRYYVSIPDHLEPFLDLFFEIFSPSFRNLHSVFFQVDARFFLSSIVS